MSEKIDSANMLVKSDGAIKEFTENHGVRYSDGSEFSDVGATAAKEKLENESASDNKYKPLSILSNIIGSNLTTILISLIAIVSILFIEYVVYLTYVSLRFMDMSNTGNLDTLMVIFIMITFINAILSTRTVLYNYHSYKMAIFGIFLATLIVSVYRFLINATYSLLSPLYIKLYSPGPLFSSSSYAFFTRLLTILPATIILVLVIIRFYKSLNIKDAKEKILNFKIDKLFKVDGYSKYEYISKCYFDIKSGHKLKISNDDRYLHELVLGSTGTGKSSSILLVKLNDDLQQKLKNLYKIIKRLKRMIKSGKATVLKNFDAKDFKPSYLFTHIKLKDPYKLLKKYPIAGTSVFAPDSSLLDDYYNLCAMNGINTNRVDASSEDIDFEYKEKEGFIGNNPLIVSDLVKDSAYVEEVVRISTSVADIMQMMFDMSGKSDPFFSSVNRIATISITVVVILVNDNRKEVPMLTEVRDIIDNFMLLKDYLPDMYDINKKYDGAFTALIKNIIEKNFFSVTGSEDDKKRIGKFSEHCMGLRVLFNNFLMSPTIRKILCSKNSVDSFKLILDGDNTVFNYQLTIGPVNSRCLGLFQLLWLLNAALKLPVSFKNRMPHFICMDEFQFLIHPIVETCIVLFRKYRVGLTFALHSLDQFGKDPYCEFLKGVITTNCGAQFLFGRGSKTDIEHYEALSKDVEEIEVSEAVSRTPLLSEFNDLSYSERTTSTLKTNKSTSQSKLRFKGFQEGTLFMVNNDEVKDAKHVRVNYVPKHKLKYRSYMSARYIKLVNKLGKIINKATGVSDNTGGGTAASVQVEKEYKSSATTVIDNNKTGFVDVIKEHIDSKEETGNNYATQSRLNKEPADSTGDETDNGNTATDNDSGAGEKKVNDGRGLEITLDDIKSDDEDGFKEVVEKLDVTENATTVFEYNKKN
jgi:hypothetical protein